MKYKNILYAPFVSSGGGKKLLLDLLSELKNTSNFLIILDKRMEKNIDKSFFKELIFVKNNLFSFLKIEFYLYFHSCQETTLLCFHGAPPLFKNPGFVKVFFQNRLYLEKFYSFFDFQMSIKKFFFIKFFYLCDEIIVQTTSMKFEVSKVLKKQMSKIHLSIFPFFLPPEFTLNKKNRKKYDFIYIADAYAHKNHLNLLYAWELLAIEGLFPSLVLVISYYDRSIFPQLKKISLEYKLNITFFEELQHSDLIDLYGSSRALVYPSLIESFGLPLLEAKYLNIPILASELDFVRDVCEPVETFNPLSPLSISRSVKRFMNIETKIYESKSPKNFITYVFKK